MILNDDLNIFYCCSIKSLLRNFQNLECLLNCNKTKKTRKETTNTILSEIKITMLLNSLWNSSAVQILYLNVLVLPAEMSIVQNFFNYHNFCLQIKLTFLNQKLLLMKCKVIFSGTYLTSYVKWNFWFETFFCYSRNISQKSRRWFSTYKWF